jgi:hypothetical protein
LSQRLNDKNVFYDGGFRQQAGGKSESFADNHRIPRRSIAFILLESGRCYPTENIWQFLRQNFLSNRVFDSYRAIVDACCDAWNNLIAGPDRIRAIGSRDHAGTVSS